MTDGFDWENLEVEPEDEGQLYFRRVRMSDAERQRARRKRMDEDLRTLANKKQHEYDSTIRRTRRNDPDTRPAFLLGERIRWAGYTGIPIPETSPFVGVDGEGGYRECNHPGCNCTQYAADYDMPCDCNPRPIDHVHCRCSHAVDGRTRTEGHWHVYLLLRVGARVIENADGSPLTWEQIAEFLVSLPTDNLYIIYGGGYDANHWVKAGEGIGERNLIRLQDRRRRQYHKFQPAPDNPAWCDTCNGTRDGAYMVHHLYSRKTGARGTPRGHTWPVDAGEYQIDYLNGKFFKIRRSPPEKHNCQRRDRCHPWVTISDVISFFQKPFLGTIELMNIGTEADREEIRKGKEQRAQFAEMSAELRDYNKLEVRLLVLLMEKFRVWCKEAGYVPDFFQGPGRLAKKAFQVEGIPTKTKMPWWGNDWKPKGSFEPGVTPAELFRKNVNATYYGGWFANGGLGEIPEARWQADQNAAYPFAITEMPCFECAGWVYGKEPVPGCDGYFAQILFRPKWSASAFYYPFPVRRRDGTIIYPAAGNGWYWDPVIEQAIHQEVKYIHTWSYFRNCDHDPFAYIHRLYQIRREKEEQRKGSGMVFKLVPNSSYGTFAQQVGAATYNDGVRGSWIPSYTRGQIAQFIHSLPGCRNGVCGSDVYEIATDGLFTSAVPEGLPVSKKLGDWSVTEQPNGLCIAQSGIRYGSAVDKEGETEKPKTRGLPQNLVVAYERDIRQAVRKVVETGNGRAAVVPIPVPFFHGLGTSVHRNELDRLGQWSMPTRTMGFDWTGKWREQAIRHGTWLRLVPLNGSVNDENVSYDKETSRRMNESRIRSFGDLSEFPDWAPYPYSPEEETDWSEE